MKKVVLIQSLGNNLGVDPIKMNMSSCGILENCSIIYKGKRWKVFMTVIISIRIILANIGVIEVHNPTLKSAERALMLLLMLGGGYMSAGLQLLNLLQGEELNVMHNQFIRLSHYMRK